MLVVINIPDEILKENKAWYYDTTEKLDAVIKIDSEGDFAGMDIFTGTKEIELDWDTINF